MHEVTDKQMEDILQELRVFVHQITEGRDPSHGYDHMIRVAEISHDILRNEIKLGIFPYPPTLLVMVAALLHDVADHKYDLDGTLGQKVQEYIMEDPRISPFQKALTWIIENISWSKEKKCKGTNLEEYAGTIIGYARDIVSDADKSCALGAEGYERTKKYAEEQLGIKDPVEISKHIREHAEEKLLQLLPGGYFRTATGRELALALHEELENLITMHPI